MDEGLITNVAGGDASDVDRAAKAAKAAFPALSAMASNERKALLRKITDAIEAPADQIALCECRDTNQTIRFMSKAALPGAANFCFYADLVPFAQDGKFLPSPNHLNIAGRKPIGRVGVIAPWKTPFMLSTWKIAPALTAGCTAVHRPAEFSTLTARMLSEICCDAGLPDGVLNLVNGMREDTGMC